MPSRVQKLVADTSVLVDIERASLKLWLGELPFEFVVPETLHEEEVAKSVKMGIEVKAHLRIMTSGANERVMARQLQREKPALSNSDAHALAMASMRGWILLAGDGALRNAARDQGTCIHGVLWIFDQFEMLGTRPRRQIGSKLKTLWNHPKCRLPKRDVNRRLNQLLR